MTREEMKDILLEVLDFLKDDEEEVVEEQRYIIYIGKKERNVKAPYIAINADGQLSGFTDEADVLGQGTDRIGKWTKAEIEERFAKFNHPEFLVEVD